MANMSYCRFRNTRLDLGDCLEVLEENKETLSASEYLACKRMFRNFIDFCCDNGIIEDENGELDDRLEEYLSQIPHEEE